MISPRSTIGHNPSLLRLAERLVGHLAADTLELAPEQWTLPVSHYYADERLRRERATLFRRYPIAPDAKANLYVRHIVAPNEEFNSRKVVRPP